MAKRRTRKEKESPNYNYLISWNPSSQEPRKSTDVKRQIKNEPRIQDSRLRTVKSTNSTAKGYNLASQKKDILKSVLLAGFILSLEIVVYLLS